MKRVEGSFVERAGSRMMRLASCVLGVYLIGLSVYRFVLDRHITDGAQISFLAGLGVQIALCLLGVLFIWTMRSVAKPKPSWQMPTLGSYVRMAAVIIGAYLISVLANRLVLRIFSQHAALLNLLAGIGLQGGVCALGVLFLLGLRAAGEPKRRHWEPSAGGYAVIAVSIAVALRVILIPLIHVAPTSDFNMYMEMANGYATSGEYWATDYILVVAPNILLFIVALGELFKIFGSSIVVAQCMNTLLVAGTVYCIYSLASRLMKPRAAFFAALLFAVEPSVLLLTLCVSTEALGVFPLIWALDLAVRAMRSEHWAGRLGFGLAAGAVLCFSNIIRPNAIILLIAFILWVVLFVLPKRGRVFLCGVCVLAAMIVGFFGFKKGYEVLQNDVYKQELGINYGWTLYEGLDNVNFGGWSAENAAVLRQSIAENPVNMAQSVMLQKAIERASAYTASQWVEMIFRKGINIWVYNDYGYSPVLTVNNFERDQSILPVAAIEKPSVTIINVLYLVMLAAFAVTCLDWARRGENKGTWSEGYIMLLTLVGIVLLHSFATSIPRYHYPALPFMFILMLYVPYAEGVSRDALNRHHPGI